MRWFTFKGEGASLPYKDWARAAGDPEDMLASIALGKRVHGSCLRMAGLEGEGGETITAFAHVLHHFLDEMDEERWMELRWHLQEGWRRGEPWLWDPPDHYMPPAGEALPTLSSVRNGLDRVVRPELLRLSWCMLTSAGRELPPHALEMRDPQAGMLFPMSLLEQLAADKVPSFLDEEEERGMARLRSTLRFGGRVSTDELHDALSSGRYYLEGSKVALDTYLRARGEEFSKAEVRRWGEGCLRACALCFAFRVMFLASVTGESGSLRVRRSD